MEKVTIKSLNSANVRMDNSVNAERVYDITASVIVSGQTVNDTNGEVRRKDDPSAFIANFNSYGENNLNLGYQGITPEEQLQVNAAVNAFIADVKASVAERSVSELINH